MIGRYFTDHPHSIGETYLGHFRFATQIGGALLVAGAAAMVHAVIPSLFVTTAGQAIDRLHALIHRSRAPMVQPADASLVP